MTLFQAAETQVIEDSRRKALALADAHDCAGLQHFQVQINGSSTTTVGREVAAVKCTERVASTSPGVANLIKQPNGSGNDASLDTTQPRSSGDSICDTMNVDDLVMQAQHQFLSGSPKSALGIIAKVIACRQSIKLYRLAALYACVTREAASAKAYFANVPPQFQPVIVQRCQLEGITLQP